MKARHEAILEILEYSGEEVKVDELSSRLGISRVTIRRDLEQLGKEDMIIRTYGGAIAKSSSIISAVLKKKMRANLKAKKEIARAALELISEYETIVLCDGTTTYQICLLLKNSPLEIRVITNDLNIAVELADVRRIETVLVGGKITDHHSVGGYLGEEVVRSIHATSSSIDRAFMGADAISLEDGLTAFGGEDMNIVNVMAELAKEVIVVADHTKFGNARFTPLLPLERVDIIITDSGIPEAEVEACRSKGISVIVAEPLEELHPLKRGDPR